MQYMFPIQGEINEFLIGFMNYKSRFNSNKVDK